MSIVKSLSVGDGDMFYIRHGVDSFTMIDCCLSDGNRNRILKELRSTSSDKGIHRFISTHPDDDHIRGLAFVHKHMRIVNFYCVENKAIKREEDWTEDFERYCALRDSDKAFYLREGCSRKWLNKGSDPEDAEQRGGAGIHVLWPVLNNEHHQEALARAKDRTDPDCQNICPILEYKLNGGATIMWMGDLKTEFMDKIRRAVRISSADILFAPHHGRDTGKVPVGWLEKMEPKLIVIGEAPSEHLNYYEGYNTITQNSAGDIAFECVEGKVHVYVSDRSYYVDFLNNERKANTYGYYLGTLDL